MTQQGRTSDRTPRSYAPSVTEAAFDPNLRPLSPAELFSLEGKVALVTGGVRGVGAMIARGLLAAGATVFITGRDADEAAAAGSEMGAGTERCIGLAADLSTTAGTTALADALAERTAHLDILVNNAGLWAAAPIDAVPEDDWDRLMDVNVKAVHYLTAALLPLLTARASADDPSRVINIGSNEGLDTPVMPTTLYSVSKAAVHMLTRNQAAQLAGRHVLVNALALGLFPTRLSAFLDIPEVRDIALSTIPLHRPGRPEEVAGTVVYLASRAGGYVTGQVLVVDGGRNGIGRADPVTG